MKQSSVLNFLNAVFFFLFMNANAMADPFWEQLPSLPEGNGNFICGNDGKNIIIAGGISWRDGAKIWRDTILRFDSEKRVWLEQGKLPHGLAYASCGQVEDKLFFAGGGNGSNTVPALSMLDRNLKSHTIAKLPQGLVYSGCALHDGKLYILCGAGDVANLGTVTNGFYSVELKNGEVQQLPVYPPGALMLPVSVALRNRIYSFTGARATPDSQVENVDAANAYSIADKSWQKIKSYPMPVRGLAGCALDDRYILLGGGYTDKFVNDQFIYDTRDDAYLRARPLPYCVSANYLKVGDDVYVIGGEDKMKHRSELFHRCSAKKLLSDALKSDK